MKEKIANLFNNFKAAGKKGAGHIWAGYAHDVLKEEIEKVENPYGWAYRMMKQDIDGAHGRGFEEARQAILEALES